MEKEKVVVIYSGGMDSYTLLCELFQSELLEVHAVSFNYGQRHAKELVYAEHVCKELGIPHKIVNMAEMGEQLLGGSSQTSDIPVPEGHYESESMKLTVVPNRNMIMLSMAMGYAISIGAGVVYFGAHAGDHAIYPDCRPAFIHAMNNVGFYCDYKPVNVAAPYINYDKGDIAIRGVELGLDYSKAWTCYNGREKPCGKCGACQERLEAMTKAGIKDPLEYENA